MSTCRGQPIEDKDEGLSLFAKTMKIHDETTKCHQKTDLYLKNTKRAILLKVLQQIKENPPSYLVGDQAGSKMAELDQTIKELTNILQSSTE